MKYKAIVFDMDGVLVDERSSWMKAHRYFGVCNDNNWDAFNNGQIDYDEFMRRDIGLWTKNQKPVHLSQIHRALMPVKYIQGAEETVSRLARNYGLCIVSGGIDLMANHVGMQLGIATVYANGIEADEKGYITGEGISRVQLYKKERVLHDYCERNQISPEETIAVADSRYDKEILEAAGLGIAFNPHDDEIRKAADIVVESNNLKDLLKHVKC
ncbi:MAG: HAD-IB family phosphatase [DPANN group archaeon]|nr:HAD-IB family phosphatase [DPANN group archaeon]